MTRKSADCAEAADVEQLREALVAAEPAPDKVLRDGVFPVARLVRHSPTVKAQDFR